MMNAAEIAAAVTKHPMAAGRGAISALVMISAASAYPKGVMYFSHSASSVILAMMFRKYRIAASPRPTPMPLRLSAAEMAKQTAAISVWRRR